MFVIVLSASKPHIELIHYGSICFLSTKRPTTLLEWVCECHCIIVFLINGECRDGIKTIGDKVEKAWCFMIQYNDVRFKEALYANTNPIYTATK